MSRTHQSHATPARVRRHPGLPFAMSDHAVERLRDRHMPSFSFARARVEARILSETARRTESRLPDGSEVWVATDGQAVQFVVKPDGMGGRICVTVLPGVASEQDGRAA